MPYKDFSWPFIDDIIKKVHSSLVSVLSAVEKSHCLWIHWHGCETAGISVLPRDQTYLWFEDCTQIWNYLTFGERWTCKEVEQSIKDTAFAQRRKKGLCLVRGENIHSKALSTSYLNTRLYLWMQALTNLLCVMFNIKINYEKGPKLICDCHFRSQARPSSRRIIFQYPRMTFLTLPSPGTGYHSSTQLHTLTSLVFAHTCTTAPLSIMAKGRLSWLIQ